MLLEQQRKDKKRSKKKEYMKKKRAKLHENAKQTAFDEALILNAQSISNQATQLYGEQQIVDGPNSFGGTNIGSSVGFMLLRRMPERQINAEYL